MSVYDRILKDALAGRRVAPHTLEDALYQASAEFCAREIELDQLRQEQDDRSLLDHMRRFNQIERLWNRERGLG